MIKYILLILLASFSQFSVAKNRSNVSLEEASEQIRIQSKGKVLSAKTTNFNGTKMHRIQVLTASGRVKIYQVPVNGNSTGNNVDYNQNGRRYSRDQNRETNNNYNNNSARTRNTRNSKNIPVNATPNNYRDLNASKKGESKQK